MSLLDKILGVSTTTIPLAEAVFYKNSAPHTPAERILGTQESFLYNSNITPHIGNFPESFVIPLTSGIIGDLIEETGKKRGNKLMENLGKYFPELTTGAISAYFTLGETVLPQLLPGTPDIKDVPAVLISGLAGYVLTKIGRKSGFNKRLFSSVKAI